MSDTHHPEESGEGALVVGLLVIIAVLAVIYVFFPGLVIDVIGPGFAESIGIEVPAEVPTNTGG